MRIIKSYKIQYYTKANLMNMLNFISVTHRHVLPLRGHLELFFSWNPSSPFCLIFSQNLASLS